MLRTLPQANQDLGRDGETAERPTQATATVDIPAIDSSDCSPNLGKQPGARAGAKAVMENATSGPEVHLSRAPPNSAGFVQFPTKQAAAQFLGLSNIEALEALVDSTEVHEG